MIPDDAEVEKIRAIVVGASKGDENAQRDLRQLCRSDLRLRESFKKCGDMAAMALKKIQEGAVGGDMIRQEGMLFNVEDMTADIAGPSPNPLEKILAHRIALCWLQINFADIAFNKNLSNSQHRKYIETLMQWQDRAHHRLLSAVKDAGAGAPSWTARIAGQHCREAGQRGNRRGWCGLTPLSRSPVDLQKKRVAKPFGCYP